MFTNCSSLQNFTIRKNFLTHPRIKNSRYIIFTEPVYGLDDHLADANQILWNCEHVHFTLKARDQFQISRKGQPAAGRTRYPVSLDTERKRYRPHGLHSSEQRRACAWLARLCSAVVPAASRRAYTSAPPAVNKKRLPNIRKKKMNTRTKQGRQS